MELIIWKLYHFQPNELKQLENALYFQCKEPPPHPLTPIPPTAPGLPTPPRREGPRREGPKRYIRSSRSTLGNDNLKDFQLINNINPLINTINVQINRIIRSIHGTDRLINGLSVLRCLIWSVNLCPVGCKLHYLSRWLVRSVNLLLTGRRLPSIGVHRWFQGLRWFD